MPFPAVERGSKEDAGDQPRREAASYKSPDASLSLTHRLTYEYEYLDHSSRMSRAVCRFGQIRQASTRPFTLPLPGPSALALRPLSASQSRSHYHAISTSTSIASGLRRTGLDIPLHAFISQQRTRASMSTFPQKFKSTVSHWQATVRIEVQPRPGSAGRMPLWSYPAPDLS